MNTSGDVTVSGQTIFRLSWILLAVVLLAPSGHSQSRAVSGKTRRDIEKAITEYNTSLQKEDAKRLARWFDVEAELDRVIAVAPSLASSRDGLTEEFLATMVEDGASEGWVSHEVFNIHLSDNGREATAYLRGISAVGEIAFVEIDLAKHGSRWKFVDFFDIDLLMPLHLVVAAGFADTQREDVFAGVSHLVLGREAFLDEDYELLDEQLGELDALDLSESMNEGVTFLKAMSAGGREEVDGAADLILARRAERGRSAVLSLVLASFLLGAEQFDRALDEARALHELVGDDPVVCTLLGNCYRALDRHAEALPLYATGLESTPSDVDLLVGFLLSSDDPAESKRRLEAAQAIQADVVELTFVELEEGGVVEVDAARLEVAARVWIDLDESAARPRAILARGLAERGAVDEASTAFVEAIDLAPDDTGLLDGYLELVWESEDRDAGLQRCPNRAYAFEWFANKLLGARDADSLAELMSAHDAAHAAAEAPELPHRAWYEAALTTLRMDAEPDADAFNVMGRAALSAFESAGKIPTESPALYALERCQFTTAYVLEDSDLMLRLAREATARDGDPYWEVVAHVARGEHEQALTQLARGTELGLFSFETILGSWMCKDVVSTHAAYAELRGD